MIIMPLFCTLSGNWFEHFERFVQQITYIRGFIIPSISANF